MKYLYNELKLDSGQRLNITTDSNVKVELLNKKNYNKFKMNKVYDCLQKNHIKPDQEFNYSCGIGQTLHLLVIPENAGEVNCRIKVFNE